jgi:DNA-binding MarR family transcriptional regulator
MAEDGASGQRLGAEITLLAALLNAGGRTEAALTATLAEVGLSPPQMWALIHLVAAGEALPLGQLAERIGTVKSNATQLVDRMEAEGLVRRVHDPRDRRVVLAEITAEGRRRHEAGMALALRAERELAGDLTAEERGQLSRLLERLGCRR